MKRLHPIFLFSSFWHFIIYFTFNKENIKGFKEVYFWQTDRQISSKMIALHNALWFLSFRQSVRGWDCAGLIDCKLVLKSIELTWVRIKFILNIGYGTSAAWGRTTWDLITIVNQSSFISLRFPNKQTCKWLIYWLTQWLSKQVSSQL